VTKQARSKKLQNRDPNIFHEVKSGKEEEVEEDADADEEEEEVASP
jgi:hypothetical protein